MFYLVLNLLFFSYLAISTAIATEADFMFIPEEPVSVTWKDEICAKLQQVRPRVLRYPMNFSLIFCLNLKFSNFSLLCFWPFRCAEISMAINGFNSYLNYLFGSLGLCFMYS